MGGRDSLDQNHKYIMTKVESTYEVIEDRLKSLVMSVNHLSLAGLTIEVYMEGGMEVIQEDGRHTSRMREILVQKCSQDRCRH